MNRLLRIRALLIPLTLAAALAAGCSASEDDGQQKADGEDKTAAAASKNDTAGSLDVKLVDDRRVYDEDDPSTVVTFYLTVTEENLGGKHPLTWSRLNGVTDPAENTPDMKMQVLLQEGDEDGLVSGKLGFGEQHSNGELTLRGKSTLTAHQKSYKIKLYDEAGTWREQTTINLVKHAYDFTRLRNRLSFDYMKMIPNISSLRVQFVHLYVKDMTSGERSPKFEDYGLYEQIEQPNKKFLRAHGLDPSGQLYKANNFVFDRYPDQLKKVDDPGYDEAAFESVLSTQGNNDHTKLLQMLDDINNYSLNFDEVFDRHFDRDNYLTWVAINILMDNADTISQNFYLYSPQNVDKWFFLPWDYDGGWGYYEFARTGDQARQPWLRGLSIYWETALAKRFFKNPDNVQQLVDKVEELKSIINPKQTRTLLDSYRDTVMPFLSRQPDILYLEGDLKKYDQELERIAGLSEVNADLFIKQLQYPMPFYMGVVENKDGKSIFHWDPSYDLQGDDLTYRILIGTEPNFTDPIYDEQVNVTTVILDMLAKGHYYWKVEARDSKGNVMPAFDTFRDVDRIRHYGVRDFYVE